jgi:hypothetical protein
LQPSDSPTEHIGVISVVALSSRMGFHVRWTKARKRARKHALERLLSALSWCETEV